MRVEEEYTSKLVVHVINFARERSCPDPRQILRSRGSSNPSELMT